MPLKRVAEVRDPLRKCFKKCPRCQSTTLVFTCRTVTGYNDDADLIRCPKYLGGCGWMMTREQCVEKYGDLKEVNL